MYELIKVSDTAYYMDCPSKVGFYKTGENEVVLIDSGSDKDAAKKVKKILDAQGWRLKAIYNTHSHADHIGGNQYLQNETGCKIYANGVERYFAEFPMLEPISLYGGFAPEGLKTKFLMAKESTVEPLTNDAIPDGLEAVPLPGHCFDMVGFRTADGVVFLADCLSSKETLDKYGVGYIYDVKAYLETLEKVKTLEGGVFVPSHATATDNIAPLCQINIDKTCEIIEKIASLLCEPKTFETLLRDVFNAYGLNMSQSQHALVGSTIRSYLTYLENEGHVSVFFENNTMYYKAN